MSNQVALQDAIDEAAGRPLRSLPNLGPLYAALAKAQAEIKAVVTDAKADVRGEKASYSYKYATLAAVWEACHRILSANGLCVIQIPESDGNKVTVKTVLGHSSGASIEGRLTMRAERDTPQAIGSAITYARRYSLASMVGIASEDDDGAAAERPWQAPAKAEKQRAKKEGTTPIDLESAVRGCRTFDEIERLRIKYGAEVKTWSQADQDRIKQVVAEQEATFDPEPEWMEVKK